MPIPALTPVNDQSKLAQGSSFDAVVVVAPSFDNVPFADVIAAAAKVDERVGKEVTLLVSPTSAGGRIIVSPTGTLDHDTDDVRNITDAVSKGIKRAKAAGSVRPVLVVKTKTELPEYEFALHASLLSVLQALYADLQARESLGEDKLETVKEVGFLCDEKPEVANDIVTFVRGLEEGKRLARDIGACDPERMTPLNAAKAIKDALANHKNVKVEVVSDVNLIFKEYPLLHAVARASTAVPRHHPCIVRLEYNPEGAVEETIMISGKGVTYDTVGADVKAGGHMAGMSRDKCGAAAGAGLVLAAAVLRPAGLRIIAELGFVRNSVGADAYVADEIITSHAGARVCVGNTDAEGRMVLSDCLSHLRAKVVKEKIVNPRLFTIATLTGHVIRAYGSAYTAIVDNGPASKLSISADVQKAGHLWADPFEISTLRREDIRFIQAKNQSFDILQCNNEGSSATSRGHQFPFGFIQIASGLADHGRNSANPIPYSHCDVAGSALEGGDFQFGKATAAPLVALAAKFILPRLPYTLKSLPK